MPAQIPEFAFEDWWFTIENGLVLPIPSEAELPERYRSLHPDDVSDLSVGRDLPLPGRRGIRVVVTLAVVCPSLGGHRVRATAW
ncbi:MAG: hypothetical protein SCH98_18310 [Deferrisomatales bacterium]|nr:hypothetical protein [Deferrisomatales bacterium]